MAQIVFNVVAEEVTEDFLNHYKQFDDDIVCSCRKLQAGFNIRPQISELW